MNLMVEPGEQLLPTQFNQKLYLRGACGLKHGYCERLQTSCHITGRTLFTLAFPNSG